MLFRDLSNYYLCVSDERDLVRHGRVYAPWTFSVLSMLYYALEGHKISCSTLRPLFSIPMPTSSSTSWCHHWHDDTSRSILPIWCSPCEDPPGRWNAGLQASKEPKLSYWRSLRLVLWSPCLLFVKCFSPKKFLYTFTNGKGADWSKNIFLQGPFYQKQDKFESSWSISGSSTQMTK